MRKIGKVFAVTCLAVSAVVVAGCASGGTTSNDNMVAATVNGRNIMLQEVEREVNRQAGGNPSSLSQLQLAQARLTVLSNLIQREVLFQRAEREKVLPTEAQIDGAIAQQKEQAGTTQEDFDRALKAQNMSIETLREEARKNLAIAALQDKYSGKITISDREVEDFYSGNRQQFKNERGVAVRVIDLVEAVMRDPFGGPGKPEPLKYVLAGCWPRACHSGTPPGVPRYRRGGRFLQARSHY